MRNFNARLVAPLLRVTGFRFSKNFRHGTTRFHRVVYFSINTVMANIRAGLEISDPWDFSQGGK